MKASNHIISVVCYGLTCLFLAAVSANLTANEQKAMSSADRLIKQQLQYQAEVNRLNQQLELVRIRSEIAKYEKGLRVEDKRANSNVAPVVSNSGMTPDSVKDIIQAMLDEKLKSVKAATKEVPTTKEDKSAPAQYLNDPDLPKLVSIQGDKALFKVKSGSTFLAQRQSTLPGNYLVKSISVRGVVLQRGSELLHIPLPWD